VNSDLNARDFYSAERRVDRGLRCTVRDLRGITEPQGRRKLAKTVALAVAAGLVMFVLAYFFTGASGTPAAGRPHDLPKAIGVGVVLAFAVSVVCVYAGRRQR
jgi:cation transporter-like permease